MSCNKHRCECSHENVKFCKNCNVVHCKDCNQEWQPKSVWGQNVTWTYPTNQRNGFYYQLPQTTGTSTLLAQSSQNICLHKD